MALGRTRRLLAPLLVTVAFATTAGTAALVALPTPAFADSTYSMESQFIADVNAARQSHGMRPYAVASDLTSVARSHSQQMASKQSLYHNPSLTSDVHNWQAVGENVGEGPDVQDIHDAFMASTEHRDNILDHDFTEIGVGVSVDKDGTVWVTEDFREPMQSSSGSGSGSGSTHHATASHPASSGTTSGATSPAAPSTSAPSWSSASPARQTASARPTLSPRLRLLDRLRRLRHHRSGPMRTDPVAQSFVYVANLSRLAG